MICPECGEYNVAEGMNSCVNCGANIPEETQSSRIIVSQKIGNAEGSVTGVDMRQQITNYFFGDSEAHDLKNKRRLLEKVKKFWIEGVFEKSVHGAVLIELGKETQMDKVERPWDVLIQTPDHPDQALPADKKIIDVFDEMGRSLLILGMPGSGKTTTILELARDKIRHAENDPTEPIPVVFNLSSWTNPTQSIANWLIEELKVKYQIPKKIGSKWVENSDLLLLLDGLDEVKIERREACVEAINVFCRDYSADVAICSRAQEYQALKCRLQLQSAIFLQPLTTEQIERYIAIAGRKLAALDATLKMDATLLELAKSPLMLSIMCLAYSEQPIGQPSSEHINLETRSNRLFDAYVSSMFNRQGRTKLAYYTRDLMISLLSWLAGEMIEHGQTIFLIEQLQPSWLSSKRQRWIYMLSSRFIGGMIVGIASIPLLTGMLYISSYHLTPIENLTVGFEPFNIIWVIGSGILSIFLVSAYKFERGKKGKNLSNESNIWKSAQYIFIILFIYSVILAPIILYSDYSDSYYFGQSIIRAIAIGLIFGLSFALVFGPRIGGQSWSYDIRTNEGFSISRIGAIKGALLGLAVGLMFLILYKITNYYNYDIIPFFRSNFVVPCFLAMIFAIFGSFSRRITETKIMPNQGIMLTLRNCILAGLTGALALGLLSGFYINYAESSIKSGLMNGLVLGLSAGLLSMIWFGGLDVIQHYTLRVLLIMEKKTLWSYAKFLDYCVDQIFLQRVGGGYIFIHRMLMEYFAELEPEPLSKRKE